MKCSSFPGGPHEPTLLRNPEKRSFACQVGYNPWHRAPDNVPSDGQWAHEGCKLITYFSISPIHVRWFTHGVQFIACMQNLHRLFQYIYYAFTWYLKNLRSNGSDNRSLIMADYFRLMRRRIFPYKMYCVAPSFWAVLGRLRVLSETVRRCDQNNTCASKYG